MKLRLTYRELSLLAGVIVAITILFILWLSRLENAGLLSSFLSEGWHENLMDQSFLNTVSWISNPVQK